ncbi:MULTISPECIES: hypothetical protein [unclassified Nitratiruptor]|uniref:hypothetical protein n=1 Tax=unclassified Nitratiruptor TaxID=2624044 RepID=UPI001915FAC9|nr:MULTISPECIES: hypothetical protein [unclassified Nitratiruptor]BCD61079.1 hypothetical protein NitYY0810_C1860 [Nitratiruptor sp. YY08-10]BCD65012.1 hypothetical protein NitYY0814_C1869 [Nitratiruptor sp. YY08-14]
MKKIGLSITAAVLLAAGMSSAASASALENIVSNPKVSLEVRPRYEYVDQDGFTDEANAVTVRTALGLNAQLFGVDGLGAQFQVMNVTALDDDYAPENDSGNYPVVADPEQTRVTQANISYSANGFTAIVGRKMVTLDNHRFIGNVGWRQMPQTYDLAAVIYNGIENLNLLGAYVWNVNRIFNKNGDGPGNKHMKTGSILLHASYKVMPELTITAYDYMIENLMDHIGLRLTGNVDFNGVKVNYTAEYAVQKDPSLDDDDDWPYTKLNQDDPTYYNLNVTASYNGFIGGLGYEVLGDAGTGDMAFNTPLATLHAMNGWADKFLSTPADGLEDFSVKLGYNAGEYGKIIGIYHDFNSDRGSTDYGTEVDIAYTYKINKNIGLLLKYADYNADQYATDTTKYWVQLDYKFSAGL